MKRGTNRTFGTPWTLAEDQTLLDTHAIYCPSSATYCPLGETRGWQEVAHSRLDRGPNAIHARANRLSYAGRLSCNRAGRSLGTPRDWTAHESAILATVVEAAKAGVFPLDWAAVGDLFKRSSSSCRNRYRLLVRGQARFLTEGSNIRSTPLPGRTP